MYGGPSQMDLFDYKPELVKIHGQDHRHRDAAPGDPEGKNPRPRCGKFERRGQSGLWCSDAFPHLSQQMDKMAVIKSLYMDLVRPRLGQYPDEFRPRPQGPALGAWIAHGLGSANKTYVVRCDARSARRPDPRRGQLDQRAHASRLSGHRPAFLRQSISTSPRAPCAPARCKDERIDAINALNGLHISGRKGYSNLPRIASYELAYQCSRPPRRRWTSPSESEKATCCGLYGLEDDRTREFGRQCLLARRLVERGVRFVQLYSGGGHQQQNWDAHNGVDGMPRDRSPHRRIVGRPRATRFTPRNSSFGRRIRATTGLSGRQREPRPQSQGLHLLDGRRRRQRRNRLRRSRRTRPRWPSSTDTTSATSTPPSSTSWALDHEQLTHYHYGGLGPTPDRRRPRPPHRPPHRVSAILQFFAGRDGCPSRAKDRLAKGAGTFLSPERTAWPSAN